MLNQKKNTISTFYELELTKVTFCRLELEPLLFLRGRLETLLKKARAGTSARALPFII
jgi:hypothetical protein